MVTIHTPLLGTMSLGHDVSVNHSHASPDYVKPGCRRKADARVITDTARENMSCWWFGFGGKVLCMDADRFDALTYRFNGLGTWRGTMRGLLAGVLSLFAVAHPDEVWSAKSGKCKQPCGACEQCGKGTCKKKNGKKRCKPGRCTAKANNTPCSGGSCQSGSCVAAAAFCAGKDVCADGNATDFPCNQSGTTPCVCVRDAISGAPVCAQTPFSSRGCKEAVPCSAGEICVDNTGGLCSGGTAKCALPCPNPL